MNDFRVLSFNYFWLVFANFQKFLWIIKQRNSAKQEHDVGPKILKIFVSIKILIWSKYCNMCHDDIIPSGELVRFSKGEISFVLYFLYRLARFYQMICGPKVYVFSLYWIHGFLKWYSIKITKKNTSTEQGDLRKNIYFISTQKFSQKNSSDPVNLYEYHKN